MIEMIVPEPKIINAWSDFDGERTEKYNLYDGCATLSIKRDDYPVIVFYKEGEHYRKIGVTIPEAISILNSLGFNFKEGE